ncbi:HNH endonuclease [Comamonas humi]
MNARYPIEKLREKLAYDPETGLLTWIEKAPGRSRSKSAGNPNGSGYIQICVDGTRFKAHRVAWAIHFGQWPSGQIDHINGNRSDNRLCNLRDVSPALNAQNRHVATSDSAPMGTTFHKRDKRWIAQIYIDGKQTHIGSFDTADQAHEAYRQRKREMHPASTL